LEYVGFYWLIFGSDGYKRVTHLYPLDCIPRGIETGLIIANLDRFLGRVILFKGFSI
jgi:hypothetical protein